VDLARTQLNVYAVKRNRRTESLRDPFRSKRQLRTPALARLGERA
jgi:hypothetical protein